MEVIASSNDKERPPLWKDPIWKDKENRQIVARRLSYDGEYNVVHINAYDAYNKDFDEILEMFGEEQLDKNTEEHRKESEEREQHHREQKEADMARAKQEVLFNMKLEAFEIEEIRNSTNRDLKKRLRKAKTPIEVQAFATLMIQEALANEE
jgi:hypothetical protein